MKLLSIILVVIMLSGCAGFSVGVGYHKSPVKPVAPPKMLSLSPAVIESIIAIIGTEQFTEIMKAALPPGENVWLGVWLEYDGGGL